VEGQLTSLRRTDVLAGDDAGNEGTGRNTQSVDDEPSADLFGLVILFNVLTKASTGVEGDTDGGLSRRDEKRGSNKEGCNEFLQRFTFSYLMM
jgi:hypothetical protein